MLAALLVTECENCGWRISLCPGHVGVENWGAYDVLGAESYTTGDTQSRTLATIKASVDALESIQ